MSIRRNTAYNLVGGVIPILTALLSVPIYIHLIGEARYGVLAIAWMFLGYFGLFDLGLGRATSFRVASLRDATAQERADTFWAALAVNCAMGGVGAAALWGVAAWFFAHVLKVDEHLRPEIVASVPLLALSVPVATITGVLTGALQGRERFLKTNVVSVVSTFLFQGLPLLLAWKVGPNLVLILAAALLARGLAMGVLAWWCFHELVRGPRARLHKGEAPLLLKYGGWVTVTSIIGPWLLMMDRFAIGATLGAVAVAIYTVPLQLAKQVAVFPGALTGALFPSLSAASVETRQRYAVNAVYALSAMVSLPVLGGIFLIDPVMHLWIGRSIAKAGTPVGRILLIGFWSNAFALIPYTVLQSRGRPDLVTKITLSEIPFYFLILWLGLKTWGVEGVGVAVAVRLTADYLLLSWVAERAFPAWPTLLGNLALLLIGLWLASLFGFHDWRWWACGSALGLAMVGLNWATLPSELRRRVIDWLSRYGGGRVFRPVAAGAEK